MAKTAGSAIGIDIGTHTIKIAELRAGRDRHTLTAAAVVPSPAEGVDHNGIYDPAVIASALKGAISEAGIGVKQAVLGISGQASVVVRMLEVPPMTATEMKEHMQWEIQRNIPFAETTIVSDYARVPETDPHPDPTKQMDVVLGVAPQSGIDTSVEVMEKAGLDPMGIDVQPLALSRVLSMEAALPETSMMIVNIGRSTTSIDVFKHGYLSFPRVLPLGGQSFTQAIADAFGISVEEAEEMKLKHAEVVLSRLGIGAGGAPGAQPSGFAPPQAAAPTTSFNPYADVSEQGPTFEIEQDAEPAGASSVVDSGAAPDAAQPQMQPPPVPSPVPASSGDTDKIFDAIMPILEELTSEIRRSVEYYAGRGVGEEVGQVLLSGGGARLKNLDRFLEWSLNVPVGMLDAMQYLHLATRRQSEQYLRENALELNVAIGMALHAFEE